MKPLEFFSSDSVGKRYVPICDVIIGSVVRYSQLTKPQWSSTSVRVPVERYGHVVGFTQNSVKETILLVKWEDEDAPLPINSTNVEFFN